MASANRRLSTCSKFLAMDQVSVELVTSRSPLSRSSAAYLEIPSAPNPTLVMSIKLSLPYIFTDIHLTNLINNQTKTSLAKVIWEEGRVAALSHTYAVKCSLVTMARPKFAPKVPLIVDRSPNPTTCLIPGPV